uniref:non-specific serine/threonine protein kinase n=1 Tax=Triticum urartu TaxID=4572 RepID=A0A8R7VHB9_TRIUA
MDSGVIELTRNEIHDFFSVGRASYTRPVPLWDKATGEVASFSSNFTFQIRPESETNQVQLRDRCKGDDMAFFLSPYPSKPPNSYGKNLALFNDSNNISTTGDDRVVAVEFDTVLGDFDASNSRVGIDVNSIKSKAYTNVTRSMVTDDAIMAAEISYDAETGVLAARLQMEGDEPYNVKWTVDMTTALPQDVAVGFSAATGMCIELHQVLSWSFTSTLDRAGTSSRWRRLVDVIVSSAVVAFVALLCAVAVILVRRRRMWQRLHDSDDEEHEQAEFERGVGPRRYRYGELAAATKDFADEEKLERGDFGNVYRGSLSDQDRPVAIKMLFMESSAQGRREFDSEVKIISRLRHRNLVQLLGWSDSRRGLLLVYELVSEGSLD